WPAAYVGESIGLPLFVASLVVQGLIRSHPLTASTGRVEMDGRITGVSGIRIKIEAARRIGVLRVLVPRENLDEAKKAGVNGLVIVPVSHIDEVLGVLRQSVSSVELGYSGLVRLVRASIPDFGLALKDELDEVAGHRFLVANAHGTAGIWVHTNGNV